MAYASGVLQIDLYFTIYFTVLMAHQLLLFGCSQHMSYSSYIWVLIARYLRLSIALIRVIARHLDIKVLIAHFQLPCVNPHEPKGSMCGLRGRHPSHHSVSWSEVLV